MWSDWLVFCDCGLHFVCPLMNKDKEAYGSFLIGETDCGEGWILFWWAEPFSVNLLTFCWWAGLCPLSVVWPEAKLLTHWRLPDTHRQVWLSLLWGHCFFLLAPHAHKVWFVPSKSLFPQSCGGSVIKSHWHPDSNFLGLFSPFAGSQGWGICCGS